MVLLCTRSTAIGMQSLFDSFGHLKKSCNVCKDTPQIWSMTTSHVLRIVLGNLTTIQYMQWGGMYASVLKNHICAVVVCIYVNVITHEECIHSGIYSPRECIYSVPIQLHILTRKFIHAPNSNHRLASTS